MLYAYPYDLTPEPKGGFSVSFPDVPEAITQGETLDEARKMAEDALATALSFYVDDAQAVPKPSPSNGRPVAFVPILLAAKLALHDALLAKQITNVELGFLISADEKAVRRFRDLLHKSRIENLEAALKQLGYRLGLTTVSETVEH